METPERLQYALLCNSEETRDLKCKVQKEKKLVRKKKKTGHETAVSMFKHLTRENDFFAQMEKKSFTKCKS